VGVAERVAARRTRWAAEADRDLRAMVKAWRSPAAQRARAVLALADDCGLSDRWGSAAAVAAMMLMYPDAIEHDMDSPELVGLKIGAKYLDRVAEGDSQDAAAAREFRARVLSAEVKQ